MMRTTIEHEGGCLTADYEGLLGAGAANNVGTRATCGPLGSASISVAAARPHASSPAGRRAWNLS
jgi:hypothetical protein